MTSGLFTGNGMRRAALAFAVISLPLWLVGCSGDDDDDDVIVPRSIDFCRLQRPVTIDAIENSVVTVFGRVYSAGLTDLSGVTDPDPAVIGAVGAGPDGSDPATDPGWTWFDGEPNPGYGLGSPNYETNADEYQAGLVLPGPPGDYDFAFRFSGDAGDTFTFCDSGLGTIDGYDPAEAGQLTSTRGAVVSRICRRLQFYRQGARGLRRFGGQRGSERLRGSHLRQRQHHGDGFRGVGRQPRARRSARSL